MGAQIVGAGQHVVDALGEHLGRQRATGDDPEATRMRLQSPHRDDEHRGVRGQARLPALDVDEPLRAHVGAEARLRDEVVTAADRGEVGDHRRVAGRDVAERAAVDERGSALEGLQQVGLDGVAQHDGHRAGGLEVLGGHGRAVDVVTDDDPPEAGAQVRQRRTQRQRHADLAGRGDVEARLPRHPIDPLAEPDDDVAQRPVIDVEHSPPRDRPGVQAQRVSLMQVVVDHRGEQVMGGGDRVEVARQVQVHPLHRHDLRVAGPGRATLDSERRAHRRLPQREHGAVAPAGQPVGQTDRRRRLALPERSRCHRRDDDVPAQPGRRRPPRRQRRRERDLRDVAAVRHEPERVDAGALRHLRQRTQPRLAGDLQVVGLRASGEGN